MEPTIRSGDLLLVDRSKSRMKGDGIYLINLDDGLMVKRVEWLLGGSVVIRGQYYRFQRTDSAFNGPGKTPHSRSCRVGREQDMIELWTLLIHPRIIRFLLQK